MSPAVSHRTLSWDWYDGVVPDNVTLEGKAYLETTYSFLLYRSRAAEGVRIGHGATVYLGTMFDVGPRGRVSIGQYSLVNGAWFICDAKIEIGEYALVSWNVVFMDTYRVPFEPERRRKQLRRIASFPSRRISGESAAQPIRLERNVWVGFDCCILPGVTIGEGSIVGARSVVTSNVPPFTIVAGNPARAIRQIERTEHFSLSPRERVGVRGKAHRNHLSHATHATARL
jgi:acetyltransferase-like isoleucine patch superfamily enzyme